MPFFVFRKFGWIKSLDNIQQKTPMFGTRIISHKLPLCPGNLVPAAEGANQAETAAVRPVQLRAFGISVVEKDKSVSPIGKMGVSENG